MFMKYNIIYCNNSLDAWCVDTNLPTYSCLPYIYKKLTQMFENISWCNIIQNKTHLWDWESNLPHSLSFIWPWAGFFYLSNKRKKTTTKYVFCFRQANDGVTVNLEDSFYVGGKRFTAIINMKICHNWESLMPLNSPVVALSPSHAA